MDIQTYIEKAKETAIYPHQGAFGGITYVLYGLAGEVGECFEVLKKIIRDDNGKIQNLDRIKKEIGDVCWYFSQTMAETNSSFSDPVKADGLQEVIYEKYLDGNLGPKRDEEAFLFIQGDILIHAHFTVSKIFKEYKKIEQTGIDHKDISEAISGLSIELLKIMSVFLSNLDIKLSEVMQMNLDKLAERKEAGKIKGSGEELSDR